MQTQQLAKANEMGNLKEDIRQLSDDLRTKEWLLKGFINTSSVQENKIAALNSAIANSTILWDHLHSFPVASLGLGLQSLSPECFEASPNILPSLINVYLFTTQCPITVHCSHKSVHSFSAPLCTHKCEWALCEWWHRHLFTIIKTIDKEVVVFH